MTQDVGEGVLRPQIKNMQKLVIAGIDEVGRGALFGPVFAGAVNLDRQSEIKLMNAGVKDSKKLSAKKRSVLVPFIKTFSKSWALGQASAREIDHIGIRKATELAMIRAVQKLTVTPDLLIIDGCLELRCWGGKQTTCIKGEDQFPAIAAASVLAKVARDELIIRLSSQYPNFGLEKNVGYGTQYHRKKLIKLGPSPLHRKTFLSKIK